MSRRRLPSPAMVIACLALIAAIGGSAYAASKINGKNIKNNTVTGKQIKEKTVKNVKSAKKAKKANTAKFANRAGSADKAKQADDATTVGGQSPNDLRSRWLLLNERGQIVDQSGGFTVIDGYDTNANTYIDAGSSLIGKGLSATIAIQNRVDTNGVAGADPNFAGEVSVARCQIPDVVECAPPGAKNVNSLVVSPRNSDGTANATPSAGSGNGVATKRVYVTVTEATSTSPYAPAP